MGNSYLNIVTFLLTTVCYYLAIKPELTYDIFDDNKKHKEYVSSNYMNMAIYLVLIIVIQFMVNASIIATNCGGSITENMGAAGIYTFIPWVLIFGVILLVLSMFPGFKSAFSDVIGYYWVSSSANKIITELLINPEIQKKINTEYTDSLTNDDQTKSTGVGSLPAVPAVPSVPAQVAPADQPPKLVGGGDGDTVEAIKKKEDLQTAADAIIKICGNMSVLINQIVPSNFKSYWKILEPLMKEKYQSTSPNKNIGEIEKIKRELFNIVVSRDNVGEAMWYIYTGILVTSLIQLKITTRGCANNPKTMEKNYQQFLDNEQKAQQQKDLSTGTTYTITN